MDRKDAQPYLPDFSGYPDFEAMVINEAEMSSAEWIMIAASAMAIRPKVAVDVGTFLGGSSRSLRHFVEHVVTIDCDAERAAGVEGIDGIEFRHGWSWEVLPQVLDEYRGDIGLVIVDASHEFDDIQRDIGALLDWQPARGVAVVIHDTAMPRCRAGLQAIDWPSGRWLHGVALDWVPAPPGSEVGGLGFLWLDHKERTGPLLADLGEGVELLDPRPPRSWWHRRA
jgi:Methyltransferase domain